jgi:hypothetical protein
MYTYATMTHFATCLPDWNSLESVRRVHGNLEFWALVFFALLVLFDVLAHFSDDKKREKLFERFGLCFFAIAVFAEMVAYPYGQRNDTLSRQIIGSLDAEVREAVGNAARALTDSSTALTQSQTAISNAGAAESASDKARQKADDASDRASKLSGKLAEDEKAEVQLERGLWIIDTKASPRSLNDKFVKALKDKPKGTADIWVFPNDKEAYLFSSSIQNALTHGAGWSVTDPILIPDEGDPRVSKSAPPDVRWGMGLSDDIMILSRELPTPGSNTAGGALYDAFQNGMHGKMHIYQFGVLPELPPDHFVIIVGQ